MDTYGIREAARLTGLADTTIRRMIKSGKLPATKKEGKYLINRDDLSAYFVASGKKVKEKGLPNTTQDQAAVYALLEERERIIRNLENERDHLREMIDRLTTKALPGTREPDRRGVVQKVREWFTGRPQEKEPGK